MGIGNSSFFILVLNIHFEILMEKKEKSKNKKDKDLEIINEKIKCKLLFYYN